MTAFHRILVPIDFSPHASAALTLAIELAKTNDATLQLVHVYDFIPYTLPEGMFMYDGSLTARFREELSKRLAQSKETALQAGVKHVETSLGEGRPYTEIVKLAAESHADLIVMGTHGRSGLAHTFVGSVAERVVRKAPCPVIAVPLKA